jgi:hypothetical protein
MSTRRITAGGPSESRSYSGIDGELYTVVNNATGWSDLWKRHTSNVDPPPALPAVDFNREFVVGAWWGDKPDGCYRLDIESVTLSGDSISVRVNARQINGACIQVITQPHDIHAVSKTGLTSMRYRVIFVDTTGKTLAEQAVTLP